MHYNKKLYFSRKKLLQVLVRLQLRLQLQLQLQLQLLVNVKFLNGREMVFVIKQITMLHVNLMEETVKSQLQLQHQLQVQHQLQLQLQLQLQVLVNVYFLKGREMVFVIK